MKQPEGCIVEGKEGLVCKLKKKSIYELKQSPRCWNSVLDNYLKQVGFVQAAGDLVHAWLQVEKYSSLPLTFS